MTHPLTDIIRMGTTLFSPTEFQFFQAGIRQGFTRSVLRGIFTESFGHGFSNSAFAATRQFLGDAARAGIDAERLDPGQRLGDNRIPYYEHPFAKAKYQVNGSVRWVNTATGERGVWKITFSEDRPITGDVLHTRAQEIVSEGASHYGFEYEIEGFDSLSVTRSS